MKLSEETIKTNFAYNLANFRKKSGMTQGGLAQKLNYSDKSVSKWERGEGLPDIFVLSQIAELFGVTVNDLIYEKQKRRPGFLRNKVIITLLSVALVWLVAVVVYFLLGVIIPEFESWILFIYAIPVSAIVTIVFSCVWWNRICRFLSVSALMWTLPLSLYITFPRTGMVLIFSVAAVLQGMTVLWFLMKKQK